jgi:hypothetical protein
METLQLTRRTLLNKDTAQATISNGLLDEENQLDAEILKVMQAWQQQLAGGKSVKGSLIEFSNGNAIRLDSVAELVEWKQIDGKPVKVICFNLLGVFGQIHGGKLLPRCQYKLESFKEPLSKQEIEIA